ncbi:MAG: AAA family ATPase, partial [Gammaproteobacteria bacterium]|nr:AAA family ATPase [Gammaproteobacteria bacterium]
MLKATHIKNFRSVENATNLELAPITVIYGPTSAGKSTILYGLCALRNFVLN